MIREATRSSAKKIVFFAWVGLSRGYMLKLAHIGCTLAIVGFLAVALSCGIGAVVVHQRIVAPPRLEVQALGYRVTGYRVRLWSLPPKDFYSIWLFSEFYPPGGGGRSVERGRQILMVPLRTK
jgi:hypothetical protein